MSKQRKEGDDDDDDNSSVSSLGKDPSSVNIDGIEEVPNDKVDKHTEGESKDKGPKVRHVRAGSLARAAELILDACTALLALEKLHVNFECCDKEGEWVLTETGRRLTTLSYLGWVGIECILLLCSMKQYQHALRRDEKNMAPQVNTTDHILTWMVCLNPFGGCVILYTLLHSKDDALILWIIQGASVLCLILSFWWQRPHSPCLWIPQVLLPVVPWVLACIVLWYTMDQGGVCYRDGAYWYDGCEVCSSSGRPATDEDCSDTDAISQESFCSHHGTERFCYFDY